MWQRAGLNLCVFSLANPSFTLGAGGQLTLKNNAAERGNTPARIFNLPGATVEGFAQVTAEPATAALYRHWIQLVVTGDVGRIAYYSGAGSISNGIVGGGVPVSRNAGRGYAAHYYDTVTIAWL